MADLMELLVAEYPQFDFFQALSLLEEACAAHGNAYPLGSGAVRLTADTSLAFPASDIAGAVKTGSSIELLLSFMGLVGAVSPLPTYFAEYAHRNRETSPGLHDFLGIFNSRLYVLFYCAWKKYCFVRTLTGDASDAFSRCIAALAGGADPAGKNDDRMFTYTGLLARTSRSAGGLQSMLSGYFGGIPVDVIQFVPRCRAIPNIARIGIDSRLGANAVCGTTMLDRSGSFRIVVGPLPRSAYETFLPGSNNIAAVKRMTQSYLVDPLDFDIEVRLQSTDLVPVVLGEDRARLGATSSLGASDRMTGVQSIVIDG